ncbi:hypothetical protein [Desulfolutivibrio sulfoxidireducens]|uniref:hypothetical protein n=1 Tax=Desulfolutivibrio sulfoxidireducens TaxID=2773299 RepID=UPI00159D35A3|nr:hypothetical protein [Desulfolutivibrio sulfoxidireducens]QLA16687.1 hypothetical protein GD605_11480 [Desulfolutivibrio sulfoxidireducens]
MPIGTRFGPPRRFGLWTAFVFLAMLGAAATLCAAPLQTPDPHGQGRDRGRNAEPPSPDTGAPEALAAWRDWVLHDAPEQACPATGNDPSARQCVFPTRLVLALDASGAAFSLTVAAHARAFVELPRAERAWPLDVRLDGTPWPVAEAAPGVTPFAAPAAGDTPRVLLPPGEHRIEGRLAFFSQPDVFFIDPRTGLVEMTRNGAALPFDLSADGRLRPAAAQGERRDGDALTVTVFRLVRDGSPLTVTTAVPLDVSGMARRLVLEHVLPPGSEPLGAASPPPLTFGPDGTLFVQAGPGHFLVEVTSRLPGRVTALAPANCPFGPEIWAFAPAPDLREVEIAGPAPIDPRNTDLPEAWKSFSAFAMTPGTPFSLVETHRGEPSPGPDSLALSRTLWLDFNGRGLTARDSLKGETRRKSTLTMPPPGVLGRVTLSGRDAPVVLLPPDGRDGPHLAGAPHASEPPLVPGVILAGSNISLTAESRYEDFSGTLPAVGLDTDVASLRAEVRLPPGWTTLAVLGPDEARPTWLGRFTLLDLFLILLAGLAACRLSGKAAGAAVLLFLILAYHEPEAPGLVWLFFLAALAIHRLAQARAVSERAPWFGRLAGILRLGAWLIMLVSVAIFIPAQIRTGLHPQLDSQADRAAPLPAMATGAADNTARKAETMSAGDEAPVPAPETAQRLMAKPTRGGRPAPAPAPGAVALARTKEKSPALDFDPEALIQTGPGLPDWSFHTLRLSFDGPVSRHQTIRLWLVPPWANLLLALARCALLLTALFFVAARDRFATAGRSPTDRTAPPPTDTTRAALGAAVLFLACSAAPAVAEHFPPPELLERYKARLIEPAPCFPSCLGSPRAAIEIEGNTLRLLVSLDALTQTAAPLPRVSDGWRPDAVTADEAQNPEMLRIDGAPHVLLSEGAHRVMLTGPLPASDSFAVDWPLVPKNLTVRAPGFQVRGLSADGTPERAVRLDRLEKAAAGDRPAQPAETARFAPFVHVARTLEMGLTWSAVTEVTRLSPPGEAVVMEIPLLPGESVLGETVKTTDGKALVSLDPGQERLSWRSRLDIRPETVLAAPADAPWVETWTISPSPIWDVAATGVPPSQGFDASGQRRPVYRPWPGERLTLAVTRPQAAPGETLTIDTADLRLAQGDRLAEGTLSLRLRAASGRRHVLTLPPRATDIKLVVDGRETAYGSDPAKDGPDAEAPPGRVEFPIKPGAHEVRLTWRQDTGVSALLVSPAVDLGHAAVNVRVAMELPRDRWTLLVFGDTPLSPVVGFWSYLAFILAAALILGGFQATPLTRRQWFLLALGLSQVSSPEAMLAAAWLFALGLRHSYAPKDGWFAFNAMQAGLVALTLAGLTRLYTAIERGLLGDPLMQVAGNGSTARLLRFTFDRVAGTIPETMVVSAPLVAYRLAMLAWSLWMALALLSWLKWGVARFTDGGAWRRPVVRLPRLSRPPHAPRDDASPPPQKTDRNNP